MNVTTISPFCNVSEEEINLCGDNITFRGSGKVSEGLEALICQIFTGKSLLRGAG